MKVNDLVVYIPRDAAGNIYKCEIGRIKRLCENGDAFICYHSGETAARTPKGTFIKIDNPQYIVKTTLGGQI